MRFLLLFITVLFCAALASAGTEKPRSIRRSVYLHPMNTIVFKGTIDPHSARMFTFATVAIRSMLPPTEILYVIIDSYGGSYRTSVQLLEFINEIPNVEIICRECDSGAALVFAASKQKRLVYENSQMMLHQLYHGHFTAEMAQNKLAIDDIIQESEMFDKPFYTLMKMTREAYQKKILDSEWYIYEGEIVKDHLADEFVKIECDPRLEKVEPSICPEP